MSRLPLREHRIDLNPLSALPTAAAERSTAQAPITDPTVADAYRPPDPPGLDSRRPTVGFGKGWFDNLYGEAFEPLRNPTFRNFWIASLISNLGTWIHEIGAGWLMTSLDPDPAMVSAVRVAMSVPIMILAIPAGALADRIDRRTTLWSSTAALFLVTVVLTVMTATGWITAWWLLAFTFAMGTVMVLHMLAWQVAVPELVPKRQLSRAVALGSISFNLGRSVGPALSGLVIAAIGAYATFGLNAVSFGVVLLVLLAWRPAAPSIKRHDGFVRSMRMGVAYCLHRKPIRHTVVRLMLYVLPASSLWALLPLYVREDLGLDARGYGVMVTTLGLGAVVAAGFLHRLHTRIGMDATVLGTAMLYASMLCVLAWVNLGWATPIVSFAIGVSWMMTLTTLNSNAQINLPSKIRGRGMSVYYTAMSFSMAAGSFCWGWVARQTSIQTAFSTAACLMILGVLSGRFLPLRKRRRVSVIGHA